MKTQRQHQHQQNINFKQFFMYALAAISCLTLSKPSQAILISDLQITEFMANPNAVSDSRGEWFELYNPNSESFDLNGILLSDNGSNSHLISSTSNLYINPGEYFVLGRNADSSQNGGLNIDYVYSNFTLGNSSDEIILSDTTGNQLLLEYTSALVAAGKSTELIGHNEYAITESFTYGQGDNGTPGSIGSFQPENYVSAPEPDSLLLLSLGLILLLVLSRRKDSPNYRITSQSVTTV